MQITFDTSNTKDLNILCKLLAAAQILHAQPEVVDNTGTVGLAASAMTSKANGVSDGAGEAADAAGDPTPALDNVQAEAKGKRGRKPKVDAPEPEPITSGDEWKVPETKPDPQRDANPQPEGEPVKQLTLDDVRGALQQFTAEKGVPAGVELLKKFNAGRISELAAADYAEFVKACAV